MRASAARRSRTRNCATAATGAACGPCAGSPPGLREETAVPAAPPAPPARKAASWILTPPEDLADGNRAALANITGRCPELKTVSDLVRSFPGMLCHRRGANYLEAWAGQAEASQITELRRFAKGLRKDRAAVTAGVTLPYSSGTVFWPTINVTRW
jgi:hypothetical protein